MVNGYKLVYTKTSSKGCKKISASGLKSQVQKLLTILREDPFNSYRPFERLKGDLTAYSRRINIQHRLVYQVLKEENIVKVLRMWKHYE